MADFAGSCALPVTVLIPVFNDWQAAGLLLPRLDAALASAGMRAQVLLVDDGSTESPHELPETFAALDGVDVLALTRNMGHQRAIAVGLAYLARHRGGHRVVVIDGDGEDDPADVPRLLARLDEEPKKVVFAERTRRVEGLRFRFFYQLYRLAHALATGRGIRFGNFSALPPAQVARLVTAPELWNHYAASVVKNRIPFVTLPTVRRDRLHGQSRMNFVSLVTHGLAAISVYSETVATRLLIGAFGMAALCLLAIVVVVGVRLFTDLAVPGWATYLVAFLLIMIMQAATAAFVVTFFSLAARNALGVLPASGFSLFVRDVRALRDVQADAARG